MIIQWSLFFLKDSFPVSPKKEHVLKMVIIVFGTKILRNAVNQRIIGEMILSQIDVQRYTSLIYHTSL